jgi:FkbM family methyltransferase
MNRRDFLLGNAAGIVVGGGAVAGVCVPKLVDARRELATHKLGQISYAQTGEDLILWGMLYWTLHIEKPDYIDIGAWEPIESNNTYLLYSHGCRGVLVEPNPVFCEKLKAVRVGDTVIEAGVGTGDATEADYYVMEGGGGQLNTFSKEEAEARDREGIKITKVVKLPLVNINKLLEQHFKSAPALFSIDTEGLDLAILKTLDFDRWRPPVFCVETILPGARLDEDIVQFMASKDFKYRGGNIVNSIFVDRKRQA